MAKKPVVSPLVKYRQHVCVSNMPDVFDFKQFKGYSFINYTSSELSTRSLGKEAGDVSAFIFFNEDGLPFNNQFHEFISEHNTKPLFTLGVQEAIVAHLAINKEDQDELVYHDQGTYVKTSKVILGRSFDLPIMGMKIFQSLDGLKELFGRWYDNNFNDYTVTVDITDQIFDVEEGKYTVKELFKAATVKSIKKKVEINNQDYYAKVIFGADFANKDLLRSLAAYYKDPKIEVIMNDIQQDTFNLAVVFSGTPKKGEKKEYCIFRNGYFFRKTLMKR